MSPRLAPAYFAYGNALLVRLEAAEGATRVSPDEAALALDNLHIAAVLFQRAIEAEERQKGAARAGRGPAGDGAAQRALKSMLARVLVRVGDHSSLRGAAYGGATQHHSMDFGELHALRPHRGELRVAEMV